MSALAQVARYRALAARRLLAERAFSILVMGPLIIGGAAWIFQAYIEAIGRTLREGADPRLAANAAALAGAVFGALVVARFSSAVRDVFALDPADHYLDALPVVPSALFHTALLTRFAHALPVVLVLLVGVHLASPPNVTLGRTIASAALPLVGVAAALAVVETALALVLVRLGVVGAVRLAVAGVAIAGIAAVAASIFEWGALALAVPAYFVAAFGFRAWRVEDRERAREALARARRTGAGYERIADRLFGPRTGAQVLRDLRLVRRGFSTSVYAAAGAAMLLPAAAAWLVARDDVGVEAGFQIVEAATILAAFSLAAITHALAEYERSRVWIDVTSGVAASEFPRAKRWTGRLLAAPAAVVGSLAAASAGLPVDVWEVGKLFWLAWATGTITGVMCYEAEGRAALGVFFAFIAAVGFAILFAVYPSLWPFWFVGYYYASWNIFERATTLAPGPGRT